MQRAHSACFLIVCSVLHFSSTKQLPSFIERCSLADRTTLGKCLIQRVADLMPRLVAGGIPELQLPQIEPLRIPKLELHTGAGSSVAFDATVTDILIFGVKDLHVIQLDIDMDSNQLNLHTQIPTLNIQGTYVFNGKVLLFEISATGTMEANITNVDAVSELPYIVTAKDGKRYIEQIPKEAKLKHKYEKVSIHFNDIFKDNQQLTEEVNKAVNENIDNLSQEVNPLIFESIHLLITGILDPIFRDYSIEELFKE